MVSMMKKSLAAVSYDHKKDYNSLIHSTCFIPYIGAHYISLAYRSSYHIQHLLQKD